MSVQRETTMDENTSSDHPLLIADNANWDYFDKTDMETLAIKLVETRPDLLPELPKIGDESSNKDKETSNKLDLNGMMQLGFQELRLVIAWARKIPGFDLLEMNDKVSLLKSSFMDNIMLRLYFRSMKTPRCLKYTDVCVMTENDLNSLGWTPDLYTKSMHIIDKFVSLNLNLTEFSILSAIVLLYPVYYDKPRLSELRDDTVKPHLSEPGDDTVKPRLSEPSDDTVKPHLSEPGDDTVKPRLSEPSDDTVKPHLSEPGDDTVKPRLFELGDDTVKFTFVDAVGIINRDLVWDLQSRMLNCLCHYCTKEHPGDILRYGKILLQLPALRLASIRSLENFMKFNKTGEMDLQEAMAKELMGFGT